MENCTSKEKWSKKSNFYFKDFLHKYTTNVVAGLERKQPIWDTLITVFELAPFPNPETYTDSLGV